MTPCTFPHFARMTCEIGRDIKGRLSHMAVGDLLSSFAAHRPSRHHRLVALIMYNQVDKVRETRQGNVYQAWTVSLIPSVLVQLRVKISLQLQSRV